MLKIINSQDKSIFLIEFLIGKEKTASNYAISNQLPGLSLISGSGDSFPKLVLWIWAAMELTDPEQKGGHDLEMGESQMIPCLN